MIQKIKLSLVPLAALALMITAGLGGVANAQDQVSKGLCAGAKDLKVTSTPTNADCTASAAGTEDKVNNLITAIINIFSVIVGIVAVIFIIYGGFRYITSGGDSGNVTAAKNTILYAIVGLIIVALAQFIVRFVLSKATSVN